MSMFWALMELDHLYESADDTEYSRAKRDYKHYKEFSNSDDAELRDLLDKLEASNIQHFQYDHKTDSGVTLFYEKLDKAGIQNFFKKFINKPVSDDLGLKDTTAISTEFADMSIVDLVKTAYLQGGFTKLPVGRQNAVMLDIYGVDKERLVGFFNKLPEFNHEVNTGSDIISHEFISSEYDVEIFDSFISMYRIPQNESFDGAAFDFKPGLTGFKTADGRAVGTGTTPTVTISTKQPTAPTSQSGNIVTIVYDPSKHKLRARGDDGVHGEANVAFPNDLRNRAGQQYRVDALVWNGKNYRVAGSITPIGSTNMTESKNRENNIMSNLNNFSSIFEELSALYESDELDVEIVEDDDVIATEGAEEAAEETAVEDTDSADDADEVVEVVDDTPEQVAMQCAKCGAICLCDIADLVIDEETDLANIEQPCSFCEETAGYEVVGALVPYEADSDDDTDDDVDDDELEEGLKKVRNGEQEKYRKILFSKVKKGDYVLTDPRDMTELPVKVTKVEINGQDVLITTKTGNLGGNATDSIYAFDTVDIKARKAAAKDYKNNPDAYDYISDADGVYLAKKDQNQEPANQNDDDPAFTTYTADEWDRADALAFKYYDDGSTGCRMELHDKIIEFSACENLYKDIVAMYDFRRDNPDKATHGKDFAKHLAEAVNTEDSSLEELLDADITLSLDGGQGNDVDVL